MRQPRLRMTPVLPLVALLTGAAYAEGLLYLHGPGLPVRIAEKSFVAGFWWDEQRDRCEPAVMSARTPGSNRQSYFSATFIAETGSVLPVRGKTYVVDRVYCEPRRKAVAYPQEVAPGQLELPPTPSPVGGAPRSGLYLRAAGVEGLDLGESDVVIPRAIGETQQASLASQLLVRDGKKSFVHLRWEDLEQTADGTWQARLLLEEGYWPTDNEHLKQPTPPVVVRTTKVTLRGGDVFDIPHLGAFVVKAVLPQATNRQAWLILTPRL
jgi:hypothetical protein